MDNYKKLEFIDPSRGFLYVVLAEHEVKENMLGHENWLVIPDGAELMTAAGKEFVFWKGNGQYSWHTENSNEWEKAGFGLSDLESYLDEYSKIVWKHNKQVEKYHALISGAEAIAHAIKGIFVEFLYVGGMGNWENFNIKSWSVDDLQSCCYKFRLKPQTIKLELELPKPFEPKVGEEVFYINDTNKSGYCVDEHQAHYNYNFGVWRTEDEIKQVVEQLRKIRGAS